MTTVTITGILEVKEMLEKYRLSVRCENCNQWHKRRDIHTCPDIIDAVFIDELPLLPEPPKGE